ncbi:hypothetical protein M3Y96_00868700 [Aphelenchoides besseyi]|nr:hypothetical protein M3Y96_00868700 [Aphelenchoides besseyi]
MPRRSNKQPFAVLRSTSGSVYLQRLSRFPVEPDEQSAMLKTNRAVSMNGSLDTTDAHIGLTSNSNHVAPNNDNRPTSSVVNGSQNGHRKEWTFQRLNDSHYENVKPTLDRFAEDTGMLGFRYLHSRYKLWFRCMWALMLLFFLSLTTYQVCERISYYFISNPLITTRTYDAPTYVQFPTISVCNKMQIKASKVAEINPKLLRAIASSFDDEQQNTQNETVRRILDEFSDIDTFDFYFRTRQTVEDLFVSCQFGKSRNCMDNVSPTLTPNGFCFVVKINTTVRRPGPESTLHLLLNLETYESIPGWIQEPGIVLSFFDSSVPSTVSLNEGMHLEPGKAVTIPINDIRRLQRHSSECGTDSSGGQEKYSRNSCQWLTKLEDIRKKCMCEPILSPINKDIFTNTSSSSSFDSPHIRYNSNLQKCNISEEIFCVHQLKDEPLSSESLSLLGGCPYDCKDISFSTIVFGNELHSDITHFLPGDWEDEKEKRLEKFQLALENLPMHRISLVKHIQGIANEAQQFLQDSILLFGSNASTVPCFIESDSTSFLDNIERLHREESIWIGLTDRNVDDILILLGLEIDEYFRLKERTEPSERSEHFYLTQSAQALYKIRNFRDRVVRGGRGVSGLTSLKSFERVVITRHLFDFLKQLQQCIVNIQFNRRKNVTLALNTCRQQFVAYYTVLFDSRILERTLSSDVIKDFKTGVHGLSSVLQRLNDDSPGSLFRISDYKLDLHEFSRLYTENGKGYELLLDLLKFRKFISTDMLHEIHHLIKTLKNVQNLRNSVLSGLKLNSSNGSYNPIAFIDETVQCLNLMLPRVDLIRKSPIIKSELMSRINYDVTVAKSYSPGPEYDKVNLLFLKIYFTHFKEELIIGGTIGLYLGAALLSLAESITFLFEERVLANPRC